MEDKVFGFAYKKSKNNIIKTYAIIYENDSFIYRPLKTYENVTDDSIIEELEKSGFRNMNHWNNYLTELVRENTKIVKK